MSFVSTGEWARDSMLSMSKTFRPWDVDQVWLLPPSVQDLVPAGHVAHFVRDTVRSGLDLSAIMAGYGEDRGYPPYHPGMMTALLLYAYSQGLYSSRRIAKGCEERLDFAAVTGLQRPDFRTVSDFRKRHLAALSGLFVQVLKLCREAGLAKLGHVALDGTKIRANASKHKAMSYGRMTTKEAALAGEVQRWLAQAAQADKAEDRQHGAARRGDEMPDWVADKAQRLAKIRAAKAALEAEARQRAGEPRDGDDGGAPPRRAKSQPRTRSPRIRRNATSPTRTAASCAPRTASSRATMPRPRSMPTTRSSLPARSAIRRAIRTSSRPCSTPSRPIPAACRRKLRPMPATARTRTSPSSPGAASPAMSPPAGRSMVPQLPAPARPSQLAWLPSWRERSGAPDGAADTGCASRWSSRCSDKSKRRAASGNSACAGSTRFASNGDSSASFTTSPSSLTPPQHDPNNGTLTPFSATQSRATAGTGTRLPIPTSQTRSRTAKLI